MNDYTNNMQTRTLRVRLLLSLPKIRRSRWTDQGGDPRNTVSGWYWPAIGALNYRKVIS